MSLVAGKFKLHSRLADQLVEHNFVVDDRALVTVDPQAEHWQRWLDQAEDG